MSNDSATSLTQQPGVWEQVDLYRFFAFVFGAPTRECFEWLQRADTPARLQALWDWLGCAGAFPGVERFESYDDYEATYIALFDVGAPQPPVPLLESAHCKALPAQQIALENTQFYEVLGLRADTSRCAPDHLVTQLEFLGAVRYARENTSDDDNRQNLARLEQDFIGRHLVTWVPAVAEKLARQDAPLFRAFGLMLNSFLRHRHAAMTSRS